MSVILGKPEELDHIAIIFLMFRTTDTVENFIEKEKAFFHCVCYFSFKQGITDSGVNISIVLHGITKNVVCKH